MRSVGMHLDESQRCCFGQHQCSGDERHAAMSEGVSPTLPAADLGICQTPCGAGCLTQMTWIIDAPCSELACWLWMLLYSSTAARGCLSVSSWTRLHREILNSCSQCLLAVITASHQSNAALLHALLAF